MVSHQESPEALDVTQSQRDVQEHDGVADDNGADVTVALSVKLVFNAPLCTEGYGQVGVLVVLHKFDESEMCTNKLCEHK